MYILYVHNGFASIKQAGTVMKYWNNTLKKMTEYVPGEQPENLDEFTKLNTNENPFFSVKRRACSAMHAACDEKLRRYPHPTTDSVREEFAKQNSLTIDQIFVGNGSDEIFSLIFRGFADSKSLASVSLSVILAVLHHGRGKRY